MIELRTQLQRLEPYYDPLAIGLSLVLALALSYTAWDQARGQAQAEARRQFEFRVTQITDSIRARMLANEQVLRGAASLLAATASIGRHQWRAYVQGLGLGQSYPGVQGVGFAPRIPAAGIEAHVRGIRAEGYPQYAIRPEGARAEYAPIAYLEQIRDSSPRALGYDMYSEPVRRAAMERARDTGDTSISGKVTLAPETGTGAEAGILIYVPVYRSGAGTATVEQRRDALLGYVYGALRLDELMREILGHALELRLEIFDGAAPAGSGPLYDSAHALSQPSAARSPAFTVTAHSVTHDHAWTLRATSLPALEAGTDRGRANVVLASGVAVSLMLAAVMWLVSTRRSQAVRLARQMTRELRESEGRARLLARIVEQTQDAVLVRDLDDRITYWNRGAEVLFGFSPEEAIGHTARELHMRDLPEDEYGRVLERVRAGRTERYEAKRRNRDGREVYVQSYVGPLYDENHKHVGELAMARDITSLKHAEAALRESDERFQLAVSGSAVGIWDWSIVRNEYYLSPQYKALLGFDEREWGFNRSDFIERLHPEDRERALAAMEQHLKQGTPYSIEYRLRHKDGSYRWFHSRGQALWNAAGEAVRMSGSLSDISERKEIERLKNEFIATVSHELRTPLTAIVGALGLLREESAGGLPEHASTFLDMASQNSERLAALINDILDLEKIESGRMDFRISPLAVKLLLERAVALNAAYGEKFDVRFELREPVPEATVPGNEDRLLQVLTNLMSNAAKFSPAGSAVTVSAAIRDRSVRIAVSDKGPGVPEEFRGRIFQKFAQADASDTRHKGGTGLGLSICKAIVEKLGGTIGYESTVGRGAVFFFDLPLNP